MYLSKCTYVEEYKPVHVYIFTGDCVVTQEPYTVRLPANGLFFYNQGMLVQNAFPGVSAEDREFITSGVSPKGWALMTQDSGDEGS